MLLKSFIFAIFFLIFYNIIIIFFWQNRVASQHQWQDNIIKAQNFIYNEKRKFNSVIVGSSLACRIKKDSIPNTYNLSFGGQSIFDGLNIILNSRQIPQYLFIETNVVLRPENINFTSSLNRPLFNYLIKIMPSLREDKQPIGLLGVTIENRVIRPFIESLKNKFLLPLNNYLKPDQIKKVDLNSNNKDSIFQKLLQIQIADYSMLPDSAFLNFSFTQLEKYVTQIEAKGTQIIFFEMPTEPALFDLPKANLIRSTFYTQFPKSKYKYIEVPLDINFLTGDGVHLDENSAKLYSSYLRNKMSEIIEN